MANSPSVKVPGGVKVTNQPKVSVGNRPEVTVANPVTVGNRPEVTVADEPTVRVANQPSRLTAVPPLDRNFNVTLENLTDVVGHPLFELDGGASGWELPKLRTYALKAGDTVQLDYSGAPLVVGGGHVCLAFQQTHRWNGTEMDVGVSGFCFTAG